MTQPTAYTPTTDFSNEEAAGVAGRSTLRTAAVDAEFANLATTLGQILTNLSILQRDDTGLHDYIVSAASLSAEVRTMITASGATPRGGG
jgi:hypothetical protein